MHLDQVRFIILGLGDSNYDSYQGFPLALYAKLTQLGAKPIIALGKADEATSALEDYVEPWVTDLWPDLETFFATGKTEPVAMPMVADGATTVSSHVATPSTATPTAPTPVATPSVPVESEKPASASVSASVATPAAANPSPVVSAVSTPQATPLPTPSGTPVPGGSAKAVRGPIVPKAPVHVSKVEFLETSESEAARFKAASYPPTKEAPYMAEVIGYRTLTAPDAVKEVGEATLKIRVANVLPGDAVGVWAQNCPTLTQRLLDALEVKEPERLFKLTPQTADPKAVLPGHILCPTSLRTCFLNYVNFNGIVSKRLLVMLAQYCSQESSKAAIMDLVNDKTKFKMEVEDCYASVLDILERYPDCKPNIGHLLDSLSPLMPRYFSISNFDPSVESPSSSDPLLAPTQQFKFAFSVERHTLTNKTFFGVATNWLKYSLEAPPSQTPLTIPIFVRPRSEFVLPSDKSRPIIMCSAGTGIAPFLGFLQQRHHYRTTNPTEPIGPAILFTGHRHPKMDWIYHTELVEAGLEQDEIYTAFSRHQPGNVQYVQDIMAQPEIGKRLIHLMLQEDAVWYICGDARRMASQVRETILKLLQNHASMDSKQASDKILEWAKAKRYLLDIWG